jgi:hypothetical protein
MDGSTYFIKVAYQHDELKIGVSPAGYGHGQE